MGLELVSMSPFLYDDYEPHTHDLYEVILNLEGEGISIINNVEYPFKPGSIHIIPPNVYHGKSSKNGFRDIYLRTDHIYVPTISHDAGPMAPTFLEDDSAHSLEQIMKLMLFRYLQPDRNDIILESLYRLALDMLNEWLPVTPLDPVVNDLISSITLSYSDPEFSTTRLLSDSGYNIDYVRRKFCKATGLTPSDYLTNLRVNYAKKLLPNREKLSLSISDISLMCGFYDQRYFSRLFKKHTGLSPSEYK